MLHPRAQLVKASLTARQSTAPRLRNSAAMYRFDVAAAPAPLDPAPHLPQTQPMLIYKILRAPEWADLQAKGETAGAPIDVSDGFVHFSTAEQARETAAKHFAGESDLTLAALDAETLGAALKWEVSRGGAEFPHLYASLRVADILWTRDLPLTPEGHAFPEEMV